VAFNGCFHGIQLICIT